MTALSILRLLPPVLGRTVGGAIRFGGMNLLDIDEAAMRRIRGNRIAMVFQEPMTSLNPVLTIGDQIAEAVMIHQGKSRAEALGAGRGDADAGAHPRRRARRVRDYPHQLSGGMRQRVMIAMALACHPQLLIADEPTTALDVTIQAQILRLMLELKERIGAAILLITHNLGVVAETCQRVIVMYAGRKVEEAPVGELFDRPLHPYTRGLMASIPRRLAGRGAAAAAAGDSRHRAQPARPHRRLRLRAALRLCRPTAAGAETPPLIGHGAGHVAACWNVAKALAA